MSKKFTITVNMDKKCKRCKKAGAGPGEYCLGCIAKMIKTGEIDIPKKRQ